MIRPSARWQPRMVAAWLPRIAGWFALMIGVVALVGWIWILPVMLRGHAFWPAINPLTALSLIALAMALLLRADRVGWEALVPAGAAVMVGVVTLFRPNTIDQWLFHERLTVVSAHTAPSTAFCLVLVGTSLCLSGKGQRACVVAQVLCTLAWFVAWTSVLALFLTAAVAGTAVPYELSMSAHALTAFHAQMSLPTALALMGLCLGGLGLCPDRGLTALLLSDSAGGMMARRAVPLVLLGLPALMYLRLLGEAKGLYPSWFGPLLFSDAATLLLTAVLFRTASTLHRIDLARQTYARALLDSEWRKAAIIDASMEAIVSMDHHGSIVEFNQAAETVFGYPRDQAIGADLADLLVPVRLRARHRQGLQHYLATGQGGIINRRVELPALHADGHEFDAEIAIAPVVGSEPPLFTAMVRDVSERKRTQAEREALLERTRQLADLAQRSAAELHTILETTGDFVVTCDAHGRFTLINRSLRRIAGVNAPDAGLGDLSLWVQPPLCSRHLDGHPLQLGELPLARALRTGSQAESTLVAFSPVLQRDLVISFIADPIRDERGQVVGAVAVGRNVTQEAEFDQVKEQFIHMAAHELKTPVTIMKAYAQALIHISHALSSDMQRALEAIDRGADRITHIVESLLAVASEGLQRLQIRREAVDLTTLVREAVTRAQGQGSPRHRLRIVSADPVAVQGDPEQLARVLNLLLDNAIRYSPAGGDIVVAVVRSGGNAVVTVQDHGIGIPWDKQGHIFERFYRAHGETHHDFGGLGLSLFLAREILQRHGGTISFVSEPDKGTTFRIQLPLALTGGAAQPVPPTAA